MPKVQSQQKVFLNFPYSRSYEDLFLGLVCSLVALGRTPAVTFDLPDHGQGRLSRIMQLLGECQVSIHDLSAVGTPVRFNMPFELGLAYACQQLHPKRGYRIFVLDAVDHRLKKTLTDYDGIDPKIHRGSVTGVINAVLSLLGSDKRQIATEDVLWIYRRVKRLIPRLKQRHRLKKLYDSRILNDLVEAALLLCEQRLSL